MAYKLIKSEWCVCTNDYRKEFILDSESDAADLPECCTGSMALVANSGGTVYVVNASGEWVAI